MRVSRSAAGWRLLVASVAMAVTAAAGTLAAAAHVRADGGVRARWHPGAPFMRGSQTVATYAYANAIRESVLVTTPLDSDGDDRPDQVMVDIVRPREAADAGVKVPVIMVASPYYQLAEGSKRENKKYDVTGAPSWFPGYYDNYFVPRGYAVALVDLPGTSRSTGCLDVGGPVEIAGVVAVVDWLTGRSGASYRDGTPAASDWSTGRVDMIGKSWDGSVANGVATTGVAGLTTIVAISAVSSWYDYVVGDGGLAPDEDTTYLLDVGNRPAGVCDQARASLRAAAGAGDYNAFWSQRDYRASANKVRASVFAVHGLGDRNVTPSQFAKWWSALAEAKVPRKLWLSQTGHIDPFDFRRVAWVDTLHRWFDYWLQGLPNGVMTEPAVSVERGPGRWAEEKSWPASGSNPQRLPLGTGDGTTGTIGDAAAATRTFKDAELTEATAVTNPTRQKAGRLVFLSGALVTDTRISGIPSVTLRLRANKPTTALTARLVDYGTADRIDPGADVEWVTKLDSRSCWGDSTPTDSACYPDYAQNVVTKDLALITLGWLDAAHHTSLSKRTPLAPDQWYPITVQMQAADAVIPAGHVLGLVVTATDPDNQQPVSTGAKIDIDLGGSYLELPVPTATPLPRDVTTPPSVAGNDAPTANGRHG